MQGVIRKIDSLLLEIFEDIELKDEEKDEADKIIESILSLYDVEQKRQSWWLNSEINNVENKKTWWSKTKSKKNNKKNKNNLFILT
jgi:hypothetical protein